ncbi:hypothetical protein M405DRAFT_164035 [Rhizopogon salebrosus TDB-379]|nr:hypothetical protein M405DRAFT_164035 [Rhizopogon salebrosus TDB-379]
MFSTSFRHTLFASPAGMVQPLFAYSTPSEGTAIFLLLGRLHYDISSISPASFALSSLLLREDYVMWYGCMPALTLFGVYITPGYQIMHDTPVRTW